MAYLLTNLPTDITNLIDEKVQELHETDYRKAMLKTLADEATEYMSCVICEAMEWNTDDLNHAWLQLVGALDELDYRTSGNYDNYYRLLLETSKVNYKAAIEVWNKFIDDFKHLSHLLEYSQANRFKYLQFK